jgi:hypothetical protein
MFIGGLAIAFWKGPLFAIICLAYTPIMICTLAILGGGVKKLQTQKLK